MGQYHHYTWVGFWMVVSAPCQHMTVAIQNHMFQRIPLSSDILHAPSIQFSLRLYIPMTSHVNQYIPYHLIYIYTRTHWYTYVYIYIYIQMYYIYIYNASIECILSPLATNTCNYTQLCCYTCEPFCMVMGDAWFPCSKHVVFFACQCMPHPNLTSS